MKDQRQKSSLKHISLIFLTIFALGITSSWLSSCSDTIAATTADHNTIESMLTSIESKQDKQSSDVQSVVTLTSKLSDDIGIMADRILIMADKIVETEKLIVEVITNQTAAATGTINALTAVDGTTKMFQNFDPASTPFILDTISKGSATSSVALKTPAVLVVATNVPPTIAAFGNTPLTSYILVASLDATFVNPVQREIDVNAIIGGATNLSTAWSDMVGVNQLNIPTATKVFVAIKSLNITTGTVSGLSNSVGFTFN